MKAVQLTLTTFRDWVMGGVPFLMSSNASSGGLHEEAGRHSLWGYVCSGTGDPYLSKAVYDLAHCLVHPREEHLCRPAQLSGPGASD